MTTSSSPPNHNADARRWRGRFFFSLGLNAALLGSLLWLAALAPDPLTAAADGGGFPPSMLWKPPKRDGGGFPPRHLIKRVREMALEAGVSEEQWKSIEATLSEPPPEFVEKIAAMRRSRVETLRAVIADPKADLEPVLAQAMKIHEEGTRAVLEQAREIFQTLEPAQREAAVAFLDKSAAEFETGPPHGK